MMLLKTPMKFQHRSFFISVIILVLFAVGCTRVPLFNYLGFEYSTLMVLLVGFVGGLLTLSLRKQIDFERKSDVWIFIGEIVVVQFALLLIPFLISLANVFFVKNCSVSDGVVLYLLIVVPGVFFSSALALVVGVAFETWRKTIFTALYILILLHIPLVTFFRPQIFAFNPIPGFFPGFTYDETLHVTQRLSIYRITTIALSGCLVAGAVLIWQTRFNKNAQHRMSVYPSSLLIEIALLALFLPLVLVLFSFSDRLGFSSSEQFIQQKLVGNYKTAHFEIIYPAGSVNRERIEQLGHLHEYYYSELVHDLNIQFQKPIVSYLYSSPEEKGKLIGAGRTDISKPWLRQIHINLSDVEMGLKHEMVHILAAEFGWSPFKISHNSGMIEGCAVALGDHLWYDEPLDRTAALVFASGIHQDMESLFSLSGFAKINAGVSYALAGSFCRSLIDSFGIEKLKMLYRSGDFFQTYGLPLSSLLERWRATVHRQQLTSNDTMKARYFFRRPSIFGKECARVIANKNTETGKLLAQHEFQKALTSAEQSLALSTTAEAVMQKSNALFEMHKFQEAAEYIQAQFNDTLGAYLIPLHLRLGDVFWGMDSIARAEAEYRILAGFHLGIWYEEACALRLEILKHERERDELRLYFTYSMEDTTRINRLSTSSSPCARFMLARELAGKEKYSEAGTIYETMGPLPAPTLEYFRLSRLGKVFFALQKWEKAKTVFQQAHAIAPTVPCALEIKEWMKRCDFEIQQAP